MKSPVKVRFFYHTPAPFGTYQRHLKDLWIRADALPKLVRNYAALNLAGAQSICYDVEAESAFQVAGYSSWRGSFCDVMTAEQCTPFLPDGYTPDATSTEAEAAQKVLAITKGARAY